MIPFVGALDFFLGFWEALPTPFRSFVSMCMILLVVIAVVRLVFDL